MAQRYYATTQTTLAAGATLNDPGTQAPPIVTGEPGDGLIGGVWANVAGTLFIEQSLDGGTTWDIGTTRAVAANTGLAFVEPIYTPVIRIRYVNGGSAQTAFRLMAKSVSSSYSS